MFFASLHGKYRTGTLVPYTVCLLMLLGCSTLKKIDHAMTSIGLLNDVSDPEPEWGQPESNAMIVVDYEVSCDEPDNLLDPGGIIANAIERAVDPNLASVTSGTLLNQDGIGVTGEAFVVDRSGNERLIISSALAPGEYRLAELVAVCEYTTEKRVWDPDSGKWRDQEIPREETSVIPIPPDIFDEPLLSLSAGQIGFIGKIVVVHGVDDHQNKCQRDSDPNHEIRALQQIIKKYEDCPWESQLRDRLSQLEGN